MTTFSYFESEPVGSASIGQVHRGRLHSGREVAIKVQYPRVVEALESDLKTLKILLTYGRIVTGKERLDEHFDEIRRALLDESDYENEALNMDDFGDIFADWGGIRAPRPVHEWTSRSVLTMDYVEGQKFDRALKRLQPDEMNDLLDHWIRMYGQLFHKHAYLHADPHPGNFLVDEHSNIWVLDYGAVKNYDREFADDFLRILVACWDNDGERVVEQYRKLGFSAKEAHLSNIDPERLLKYQEIILEPFVVEGPFDFADWSPALDGKKFMMGHPQLFRMVPPSEVLPYFRVLSGVKGLLGNREVELDIRSIAEDLAKQRGLFRDSNTSVRK